MKKALLVATVQSHIAQFHKPLIQLLKREGYEVHVAARDNLAEKNGLTIENIDKKFNVGFERSPMNPKNIKAYRELKQIVKNENYDIISCNTPVGGILTRMAARTERRKGTKVYYTAHGFHFYQGAPKKNWLIYYPIEKMMARLTDVLITITKEDYQLARKKFQTEVRYIHGVGVDETRYHPVDAKKKLALQQEMGFKAEQNIILCIGELLPNKNQIMAIQMVQKIRKQYPNVLLLLAGNGSEKEHLEQIIADAGMEEHVKMLGYCTCLEKYQQIADVLVSCSKREGLPLNIVEAMLSGNPVVATKNRGHCELLQDGERGYLVDLGDVDAMADCVTKLLSDEGKRIEMGRNAREFAEQYGFQTVGQELEEIYGHIERRDA